MVIGRMVIRFYDEFFIGASRKLLQQWGFHESDEFSCCFKNRIIYFFCI